MSFSRFVHLWENRTSYEEQLFFQVLPEDRRTGVDAFSVSQKSRRSNSLAPSQEKKMEGGSANALPPSIQKGMWRGKKRLLRSLEDALCVTLLARIFGIPNVRERVNIL